MPPKKKEEETKDDLIDDLDELEVTTDEGDETPTPDEPAADEPVPSIVDQFVNGDMEAVKQSIQDQVIKTVSDVVNGTPELPATDEPSTSEE